MTRTLTILVAIAALAVSAEAALAGTSSKPPNPTLTSTLNNTMVSGYSVKRSIVVTKATDVSSIKAKSKVTGGSNGIIAVLIGAVSTASDGTSNTLAFAERSAGNSMSSGYGAKASSAPPRPRGIVVTKPLDCESTAFMDYTDDSCMAKSRAGRVKARPKAMVTPSGGETLPSDWVKAASSGPLRSLNDVEAIDFGVKDGTSNTPASAERSAGLPLENTMISGEKAKPKSHKGHGDKGHGGVHAQWDLTSNQAG